MKRHPRFGPYLPWSRRRRRLAERRRSIFLNPVLEGLESRTVLSTITWNTTSAPDGGNWNVGTNWQGGVVPGASDTAVIKGLAGSGVVFLDSGSAESVGSVTTDSTATLEQISGSLTIGAGSSSTFGGPVNVDQGATLSVLAGATVTIGGGQTLEDDGSLNFANGDTVSFPTSDISTATTQIVVDGTMNATGAKFVNAAGSYFGALNQIYVGTGGELIASNSTFSVNQLYLTSGSVLNTNDLTSNTFNLALYTPALDVPLLANNESFEDVYILGGSVNSGQNLTFGAIGTKTTANLVYVLPSGFTVSSGGSSTFGPSVQVQLPAGQTITDDGTLTFANSDTVTFEYSYGATTSIVVNGKMTAIGDTFVGSSPSNNTAQITVSAGGELAASNSTFTLTQMSFNSSSILQSTDLSGNVFNANLGVPYGDIQYLGNNKSFDSVSINAGNLNSGTLNLNPMGVNTANLVYVFPSGFTIGSGATLNVGAGLAVQLPAGQTITDNGTLSFASGDMVTFEYAYGDTTSIIVNGNMTATGATFLASSLSNNTTQVVANAGGELAAANSTFTLTQVSLNTSSILQSTDLSGDVFNANLGVPYGDIQYLSNNKSFDSVSINAGSLNSGTLNLDSMGVNTANLVYVFPSGFTIGSGATLNVGAGLAVQLPAGQTITDNGTLSFASGDMVTFEYAYGDTTSIVVNGNMTATGATFLASSLSNNTTQVVVNAGGELAAANSTFTLTQVSLNTSSILQSTDLSGDVFNANLYVPYGDIQYLSNNKSFDAVSINAGSLNSGTLNLNLIGVNTANLVYVFPSGFTIGSGASLSVGASVAVQILAGQTITDNGTLSFASGDTVTFEYAYGDTTAVVVNGNMSATGATFLASSLSNNTTRVVVNAGGEVAAANSTFTLTQMSLSNGSILQSTDLSGDVFNTNFYVPYGDIPYLGNNKSFDSVLINTGTLNSGTLNLNLIGVNTANLVYVFSGGFTIGSGATLSVGANVAVQIAAGQTVTDNGTLGFASGDTVTFEYAYGDTTSIIVNGGMTATGATFLASSLNSNTTQVAVDFGGELGVSASTYNLTNLTLKSGSTDSLTTDVFYGQFDINSGADVGSVTSPTITSDDFSNVGANGIVASGDPAAKIPFSGNYWGTTVPSQIEAKIDNYGNGNYPTIDFQPYISGASGTLASSGTLTFEPIAQTVNLTATVSTTAGVAINEGTETFTILNGSQVIGQTTAPANVSNGAVTATYTIPAGTPAGQYVIEASYSGTGNYLPSTDTKHLLTINPGPTVTTVASAATAFSPSSNQSISLSATVSSTAGSVGEGIVTFTVFSGGNPVGSPVTANVVSNAASAIYTLLAGTAGGSYTIQAVYTDPVDFKTSTATNSLNVSAVPTTLSVTNETGYFSSTTGEGITLAANVTSSVGTVNQGSVSFTIVNSANATIASTTINVSGGEINSNYVLPAGTLVGSYTIKAIYNGNSSFASSDPESSTLAITGAPTTTVANSASVAFSTAAQLVPMFATVTSAGGSVSGTITFTVLQGSTVIGTPVQAPVSAGTASTNYSIPAGQALGNYTIDAAFTGNTDFGNSTDNTHSLTIAQPPAVQLVISTPPPSTATAGAVFTAQPVIYEEDQYGNVETSDNSTVVVATVSSGEGLLLGTATATVVGGVATFSGLGDDTAGTIVITFSSGNLLSARSGNIVISPAAASQLVVTLEPSAGAVAGVAFTTQPIVKEEDAFGNVITSDSTSTVTVARGNVGTGTLKGSTLTVQLSNGVATFTGLSYDTAETMNLAFSTSAIGVSSGDSSDITVSAAAASQLVIVQQPTPSVTVGQPISPGAVVDLEDEFGNLESTDNSTVVSAALGSGAGPLSGTTTATVSDGVARFNGVIDGTPETISLAFTSGAIVSAASSSVVVKPAAATRLIIHTEPSATATAGQAFTVQPVVYVVDQNGNLETGDNTTVVTVSLASGAGPLPASSEQVTVHGGIATFANLSDNTAETISLAFSATSLTSAQSSATTVNPGAPYRLVIHTQPSSTATAGQTFTTQPVIDEVDKYGNLESTDSSTVITATLATGNGPLLGTTSVTLVGGVATFTTLSDNTAESISLLFSGGGLNAGPSNSINVSPGAAAQWVLTIPPYSTVQAGNPLTDPIVLKEVDAYGNLETSDNSTQVSAAIAVGSGTLLGTKTVTASGGVASFDYLPGQLTGGVASRCSFRVEICPR